MVSKMCMAIPKNQNSYVQVCGPKWHRPIREYSQLNHFSKTKWTAKSPFFFVFCPFILFNAIPKFEKLYITLYYTYIHHFHIHTRKRWTRINCSTSQFSNAARNCWNQWILFSSKIIVARRILITKRDFQMHTLSIHVSHSRAETEKKSATEILHIV